MCCNRYETHPLLSRAEAPPSTPRTVPLYNIVRGTAVWPLCRFLTCDYSSGTQTLHPSTFISMWLVIDRELTWLLAAEWKRTDFISPGNQLKLAAVKTTKKETRTSISYLFRLQPWRYSTKYKRAYLHFARYYVAALVMNIEKHVSDDRIMLK